ncbi:Vicilin-like seed storage protein [Sesamum alatum]|uniref:Vicilin-like seed storage protein n=1 Tax=Sesamum alatum TaxID=300844 RepID=A0AAE2CGS4_9LAMI|nr:Vicilin-like seed storage protein [Sesamum alatum]
MGNKVWSLYVLVLVVFVPIVAAVGGYDDEGWRSGGSNGGAWQRKREKWFLLQETKHVVKTDAGEMKVVRGFGGKLNTNPMHIGFITMEPRSLFIPHYLDSSLILFIRTGEATIGHICKDALVEKSIKSGDIYRISAGSPFYLMNTAKRQKLHVICSIDTSQSLGMHAIQSFFIAGGTYPTSVLSGFDHSTLSTAFNVSKAKLRKMLRRQENGPIVYLSDTSSPWSKFLDMDQHQKLTHMRRIVQTGLEALEEKELDGEATWSVRKLLFKLFGKVGQRENMRSKMSNGPDSYNIYDRKPDFENNYGWTKTLDESDYSPLGHDDVGVYLVHLTKGSMMAPHINPRATEYGIVLRGAGTIQVVYPNGSLAMNAKVKEGDVFWIPRFFPFCQVASPTGPGPFEFLGFTTSARNNKPQFLVGANSLLHAVRGPEFAAAFGMSNDRLTEIIKAQREMVILPPADGQGGGGGAAAGKGGKR